MESATLVEMALGETQWWDGMETGQVVQVTRGEDPDGPWWEVEVLDGDGEVTRKSACGSPGEVISMAYVPLALCSDCAGMIGGACSGPDHPWREALQGEECQAEDH